MLKNNVRHISSQCQVVHFPWVNDVTSDSFSNSELSASNVRDISKYVREINFEKNLSEPAGTFEILLPNDRDWKDVIKRGTWLVIYMSQNKDLAIPKKGSEEVDPGRLIQQKEKVRCIGYVERVGVKGSIGDRGDYNANYVVTGRDFGVIYQESQIWHNIVFFEKALLNAAAARLNSNTIKTVDQLLDTFHKLFYSPADFKGLAPDNRSLTRTALQWLLPDKLVQSLGLSFSRGVPFYGNIRNILNFEPTRASYPVENPLDLLNGRAWDRLKAHSIEEFHELFPETGDDGHPHLNFRPIPWRIRRSPSVDRLFTNDSKGLLKNIDRVTIDDPVNILDFDLGEDNHSRYNLFFTTVITSLYTANDSLAGVGDNDPKTGFPRIQQSSIKRHGVRLMFNEINSLIQLNTEKVDESLVRSYNELMLEYWNNAVFYGSGTMSIIGDNSVKIGKTLETPEGAPYNHNKIFYIEGYKDNYVVQPNGTGKWTQTLSLTRGIEKQDLEGPSVARRDEEYQNRGEFTEDEG